MMRGMILRTNWRPFEVKHRRDWNAKGAVEGVLRCKSVEEIILPPEAAKTLILLVDADSYLIEGGLNFGLSSLLPGDRLFTTAGLIVARGPDGDRADLTSSQMYQISRRLDASEALV